MATQVPLPLKLDPELSFDSYIPGPNLETIALLRHLASGDGPSPFYLHGLSGSGKSHLLHAVCQAAGKADLVSMTVTLPDLAEQEPSALVDLGGLDVLCLDDVDDIAGKVEWEKALFALFNEMQDRGARLLLTAKRPPQQSPFILADLQSRLASGLVIGLKPLSEEDCIAALISQAQGRGLELSEGVAQFLIRRVDRDPGTLIRQLAILDHQSMAANRKLTIPFIREILEGGKPTLS